jgi:excisionase family DNA binding protein
MTVEGPHSMSIATGGERIAYSVDETAVRAGIGRDAVYDAIREKRLVARKWGRRTLITDSALRAFLESLPIATLDRQPDPEEDA